MIRMGLEVRVSFSSMSNSHSNTYVIFLTFKGDFNRENQVKTSRPGQYFSSVF